MFGELVESGPRRQQGRGGIVASTVIHSIVILLAAWGTGMSLPTGAPERPPEIAIPVLDQPVASAPPVVDGGTTISPTGSPELAPAIPLPPPIIIPITREVNSAIPDPDGMLGTLLDGSPALDGASAGATGSGSGVGGPGGVLDNNLAAKPALPLDGNQPPRYPDLLRRAGITGVVIVEFIIESDGTVRPGSVVATRSDDPRFLEAVRAVLPGHRFLPAEAGGRAVAVRVRQVFTFELDTGSD